MIIYLVRHPQTKRNKETRLGGWEECEYSELGKFQFKKLVEYFSDNENIIYSSDLPRAKRLGEKIAYISKSNLVIDAALRELNFKETAPYDSYETPEDLKERVVKFLERGIKNAIIVSHEGTTQAIIEVLCKKDVLSSAKGHPRDVVFKIETIKNKNKLTRISV